MSKKGLTGKRAVWFGLLGTPVLLVAAITLIGVTAGSAGPATSTGGQAATADTLMTKESNQTFAQVRSYWTPERMASARAYPMREAAPATTEAGSVQTIATTGTPGTAIMRADGSMDVQTYPAESTGALTEPFHANIPYTQWQWFGRYLRNVPAGSPNLGISAIHKMFFSQDLNENGSIGAGENFVCSSSSVGNDFVWTAGHCVHSGLGVEGLNQGFSVNVLFCPSYDDAQGGVNPTAGCWSDDGLTTFTAWVNGGGNDFDVDFGMADATDTPAIGPQPGLIGNYTGWLGLAWNWGNVHWVGFGYPQGAPFTGGKIETCASSLGYTDDGGPATPSSVSMGCDMTGGSSGGPWILGFGRFGGQPGGNATLWINGHNDWRHTAEPDEMNSPYFDCRAVQIYNFVTGSAITCP